MAGGRVRPTIAMQGRERRARGHSTVRAATRRVLASSDRRRLLADARDDVAAADDQHGLAAEADLHAGGAREQHLVAGRDALHLVADREHDAALHGHLAGRRDDQAGAGLVLVGRGETVSQSSSGSICTSGADARSMRRRVSSSPYTLRTVPLRPRADLLGGAVAPPILRAMLSHEIRTSFRDFFAARDHVVVPSASLVPPSLDPTVLLTTAGMQPFKPYFLGLETPPGAARHLDPEVLPHDRHREVGQTARHLTFFEMMGNFSFGDYFKEGAIALRLGAVAAGLGDRSRAALGDGLPRATTASRATTRRSSCGCAIGLPAERIVALGEDNFWKAGPTGPCGPCSELYYDRGPEHGCGRPLGGGPTRRPAVRLRPLARVLEPRLHAVRPRRRPALTPLPKPNIDTGAGVERIAALLQGVHSVYETDGFRAIISAVRALVGREVHGRAAPRSGAARAGGPRPRR